MEVTRRAAIAVTGAAVTGSNALSSTREICLMTATEMARRLRKKELSAREALAAHLDQVERLNPKVNAIVTLVPEKAAERAKQADEAAARGQFLGPLHGLPIAHKDLEDTAGIRTTYGSPIFRDHVPEKDALIVERIRRAGAIAFGKTNTPEFGAGSQTFNPVFGATRNPWDLSKTCGGSSGGAAVALACGMMPIADGSDMGGSLRNPASFCSVVGFRTSLGRVPKVPTTYAWNPLSVLGPLGRTAADTALLLSAIAGPDPRSPLSIREPGSRFAQPLSRDFKGVRVAWCASLAGVPFDTRVREICHKQRKTFESLGCLVNDSEPDFSGADEIFKVFRALSFYQLGSTLTEHRSQIKATVIEEIDRGAALTGPQIADAHRKHSILLERIGQFMSDYEYFVLPTTQVPPFDIEQPFVTEINGQKTSGYIDWMRSCYYVTVTGLPAISVPAGFTTDGLPVGLQIVGRQQEDFGVLQIAHAFEQASGVSQRIAPIAFTA
jgi:amidase